MSPLVLAVAVLLGAAAPAAPDTPPLASEGASEGLVTASRADAPPPEAPGGVAAETAMSRAAEHAGGRSWFALPMLFWLPETKLGFAGSGGIHFQLGDAAEASNAFFVAGYSMQGQGTVDVASDLQLASGTLVSCRFRAVHYPDSFYGIGPRSTLEGREEMTRRFVELNAAADLPILGERLRGGPRVNARAEEIIDVTPGGLVAAGAVDGADGFTALGAGVGLTYDSRDRRLWPSRGAFAQASYLYYPAALGRNGGFGRGSVEGRLFLPLGRHRVLGLGALLEDSHGETPFTFLPKLGSTRYLRGIREGRYRDRLAWAAQAELRVPLAPRVSAAAFGAFGDVGPDLAALRADDLKVAGGAGLRFRLTDEGANIRFDLAAGDDGPELYVLLLEAF